MVHQGVEVPELYVLTRWVSRVADNLGEYMTHDLIFIARFIDGFYEAIVMSVRHPRRGKGWPWLYEYFIPFLVVRSSMATVGKGYTIVDKFLSKIWCVG